MDVLDEFFETLDSDFNWEGFIQPTELEEAFQSVLQEEAENVENMPPQLPLDLPPPQLPLNDVPNKIDNRKRKISEKRFAPSLNAVEIQQMSVPFVPKNTEKNNHWALRNFFEWIDHHNQENPHDKCRSNILETCSTTELNRWLSVYVTATRKSDGGKYTPKTMNCLLSGILREIRSKNENSHLLNFMDTKNKDFKGFRAVLDRVLRQTRSEGIGANPKTASIIQDEEENLLWEMECLEATHQNHYYDRFSS